jgi:hypothetical protein
MKGEWWKDGLIIQMNYLSGLPQDSCKLATIASISLPSKHSLTDDVGIASAIADLA